MKKQDAFNRAHDEEFEILHNSHGEHPKKWNVEVDVVVRIPVVTYCDDEPVSSASSCRVASQWLERGLCGESPDWEIVDTKVISVELAT